MNDFFQIVVVMKKGIGVRVCRITYDGEAAAQLIDVPVKLKVKPLFIIIQLKLVIKYKSI